MRGGPLAGLAALATLALLVRVDGGADAVRSAGHALLTSVPLAALWIASALGLGNGAARWLPVRGVAARLALGMALLMVVDQWCGTLGLIQWGMSAALALLAPGWWLLSRWHRAPQTERSPAWVAIACGMAAGAMLAAALVPAGYLWSTEFGAYDALSYHLQSPREWLANGSMRPLPHLAYAGLPSFVEGAFMHLMALRSDPREAALACQLLHAAMAIAAAGALREVVREVAKQRLAGDLAALALLATPWVTVTGSLAYSESGVLLGLALAMAAALQPGAWRAGLLFGLGVATAIGSKASSVLLVAPAALAWAATMSEGPRRPYWWCGATLAAVTCLAPWIARDAVLTSNPCFPLMSAQLGAGWWNAEQASRFMQAHRSDADVASRLLALWRQAMVFGVGANPSPGEPWRVLWGPLPWLGALALAGWPVLRLPRRLGVALALMVALICVAWMSATHLQSRFLLPMAVPLAAAIGIACASLSLSATLGRAIALAALGWALLPSHALLTDRPGSLALAGRIDLPTGELDAAILREGADGAAREVRDAPQTEAALATLFPGARVLAVGWSAPFWLTPTTPLRWSTVWDTNPIEEALRQPDAVAWLGERFDLLVLDEPMLLRWKASGWLSPDLDIAKLESVVEGLDAMRLRDGRRLISLRGALRPSWPARPERLPSPSAY